MIEKIWEIEFTPKEKVQARRQLEGKARGLDYKEFVRGDIGLWIPKDLEEGALPRRFLAASGLVVLSDHYALWEHRIELSTPPTSRQMLDAAISLNTLHALTGGARAFGSWAPFDKHRDFLGEFNVNQTAGF